MKGNWKENSRLIGTGQWAFVRVIIALCFTLMMSCMKSTSHVVPDQYTCPMHPTVIQDKPGNCPVCGMDLVLKGKPGGEVKMTAELNYLLRPANAMVISSIRTIRPVQKEMPINAKAQGRIVYDTRRFTSVSSRISGRIEKLFVKYNFQPIRKGQKILEVYSPELLTLQRELIFLSNSDRENLTLIEGSKEKLKLLGVTDAQIAQLISSGREMYAFPVYSQVDGYVVNETDIPEVTAGSQLRQEASSEMEGGMGGGGEVSRVSSNPTGGKLFKREGMYVNSGDVIFKVVSTNNVWAEFDMYPKEAAHLHLNDPLEIITEGKDSVKGSVNFIQPFLDKGGNFTKVRVYLPNTTGRFRIGQLVTASFSGRSKGALWIPSSASYDLGTKKIVFLRRRGVFRPREIILDRESKGWLEVLSGIEPGDSIAYSAQFLVDSESFIKVRN